MVVNTTAVAVLLITFFALILLRVNIAFAVGAASTLCLMYLGMPLSNVCQQMVKGLNSFSLMAVPFFITMGCLMGTGGISEKLIALANSLVGWMRGGMAMVNIVASYFFGGISGSATADTASLGNILIPMMVGQGYDDDFSTAVTITSSVEGLLVPPSHNMVIYATAAGGVSVGALFMAGYIPGALLAVSLMIGSYIISVKRNYPKGETFDIKVFLRQLSKSFWALAAVLIVVAGVVGGIFTATESAAIAVIYSMLVSVFIYRGLEQIKMLEMEARMKRVAVKALELITGMERVAPTEFSFGYVDKNHQCREGLVIKNCCPAVINKLIEEGYMLSMTEYGLLVDNLGIR